MTTPQELAASLEWKEGRASPNGRRILWVAPAARALLSMTGSPDTAAFFAAGCPVQAEQLADRLPEDSVSVDVEWPVSDDEAMRMLVGYRPEVMEDKWRIVGWPAEGELRIFFLRSWTGALIYVAHVRARAVRRIFAPRSDPFPAPTVRALLNGYLFGKSCIIPAPPEYGDDKMKLMMYGVQVAGRHCDGVEPRLPHR